MYPDQTTYEEFTHEDNLKKDFKNFPCNNEMFKISDKALEKKKDLIKKMFKPSQVLEIIKEHFDSLGLDDFVFKYSQPMLESGFSAYIVNNKGEVINENITNFLNHIQQGKPGFTFPYNYETDVTITKNNQEAIIPISIHTLEGIMNRPSKVLKEEKPTKTGIISVFKISMQRILYICTKELEDAVRLYNSMKELKQVNTIAGHKKEEFYNYEIAINLNNFKEVEEISKLLLDEFKTNKIIKYEVDYTTTLDELIKQNIYAKGELPFYEKPSQTRLRKSYQFAMLGRAGSRWYEKNYASRKNIDPNKKRPTVNLDFA